MADEQYQWLDRDAAERLLRGEPLEGVDPHVRAQADRLAQALGALTADEAAAADGAEARDRAATPGGAHAAFLDAAFADAPRTESATRSVTGAEAGELPGEAAALAAFRAARSGAPQRTKATSRTAPYATSAHEAAAGETVRLARAGARPQPTRWGRPVRFGVAAALAACMVGGVAVAAGTGVLPSPFSRHDDPGPATSASSAETPQEPSATPSDDADEPSEDLSPDETAVPDGHDEPSREPASSSPPEAEADGGQDTGPTRRPVGEQPQRRDEAKDWYRKVVTACRAYRSGELQGEKRRRLEEAAKGAARVEEFCGRVLGGSGTGGDGEHAGDGGGQGGGGNGDDGDDGENGGDEDGSPGGGSGGGSGGDSGGFPGPPMSSPGSPRPTPTASYSALPKLP
ncbi:hypothetical protein [Streptomyces sp. NPDC052114]|uniref:hypothetical protein n=1 Tax=unclassified Streptomyces TaxID=2593676 RepID=UPI003435F6E4